MRKESPGPQLDEPMRKESSGLPLELCHGKDADSGMEHADELTLDEEWDDNSFKFFCNDADARRKIIHEGHMADRGGPDPWQQLIELQLKALQKEIEFLKSKEEVLEEQEEGLELQEAEGAIIFPGDDMGDGAPSKIQIVDGEEDGNGDEAEAARQKKNKHTGGHRTTGGPSRPKHVAEGVEASESNVELPEEYRFHESIWDASLFIGTPPMGHFGSILLMICLLAQAVMSVGFIVATFDPTFLGGYDDDLLIRLKDWRVNAGHSYKYMSADGGQGMSLVARVCKQDASLELSGDKVRMLTEISSYKSIGRVLSLLGVIVWWLVVLNDMNDCWNFIRGVYPIDRKHYTDIVFHQQYMKIICLSETRYAYAFVIMLCRVCMAAALVVAGTAFLLNTLNVAGVILNAISLDVILSLDELLYLALAPAQAKDFMNKLEPLANPPLPRIHGLDVRAAVVYPCLAIASIVIYFKVGNTIERLQQYEDALCGGERNFAYERDRGGMIMWMQTQEPNLPSQGEWESRRDFASFAVWQIAEHRYSENDMNVKVNAGEELAWIPGSRSLGRFKSVVTHDIQLTEIEWMNEVYDKTYPTGFEFECVDVVANWHDSKGYSCAEYEAREFCTASGSVGSGWDMGTLESTMQFGHTALEACCACGGGLRNGLVDMDGGSRFPMKISWFLETLPEHQRPPGGFPGDESCKDLQQFCLQINSYPGRLARAFCPASCGCDSISSGSWYFDYGCHKDARGHYQREFSSRRFHSECVDAPVEKIANWVSFLATTLKWTLPESAVEGLISDGCDAIKRFDSEVKTQLCHEPGVSDNTKSLLTLCPVGCGCQETPGPACTRSCTYSNSSLILTGFGWQGTEKSRVIEVYIAEDVEDMSIYRLGVAANARPDLPEFRFKSVPAKKGTFMYFSRKAPAQVTTVFPNIELRNHTQVWIKYNGNDNILVYKNGKIVDRYGVPMVDGIGQNWQYDIDKPYNVVYRKSGSRPNWFFSRQEWTRELDSSFGTFKPYGES